ncbi:Chlorophyll(ide) b reductase NOL, partial [Amphidinium carterae]
TARLRSHKFKPLSCRTGTVRKLSALARALAMDRTVAFTVPQGAGPTQSTPAARLHGLRDYSSPRALPTTGAVQSVGASSAAGTWLGVGVAAAVLSQVPRARRTPATRQGLRRSARASPVVRHANRPVCAGVVITGGAAGVGYAYADVLLRGGHQVTICDVKDPAEAVAALKAKHPEGSIYGAQCDVSSIESVKAFGEFVKEKMGVVHYWINNAGINGGRRPFEEISTETLEAVVKVNLGGIVICTHVAMNLMLQQAGVEGHIFNTVGSGVKGGGTPGYVAYGATKRGLPQMTDSLVREIEDGVDGYEKKEYPGKVNVHTLSPGMVFTDLLLNDSTPALRKFPFGVLAAQPEEVAEDIVPKVLNISGNGKSVEFLTLDRILTKFFEKFFLGKKSEYIDDDGNVIKLPDAQYQDNGVRVLYPNKA